MDKYAALFVRKDSAYKHRDSFDPWDAERNAMEFSGDCPVVAHPPCRSWGMLAHMTFRSLPENEREPAREKEKLLALFSVDVVRKNGGVIEHPSGSRLFGSVLPDAGEHDEFGGFTIEIDQFDFGHVAHKGTKLYVCGIKESELPKLPPKNVSIPTRSICGNVKGTTRCTQYQREYTPEQLIDFIEKILETIPKPTTICKWCELPLKKIQVKEGADFCCEKCKRESAASDSLKEFANEKMST
jgi:hypothetical protein